MKPANKKPAQAAPASKSKAAKPAKAGMQAMAARDMNGGPINPNKTGGPS